jgi:DNA-binding transcriptional ArsR family regulator
MAMISELHDRECGVDLSPAVALFRILGDQTRLTIVHELAKGERRVVDLTRHLGLAQSTVSAHLALMRESGLVDSRPVGRQSLYRLARPELLAVLAAAESLLAATGNDIDLCPSGSAPPDVGDFAVAQLAGAGTGATGVPATVGDDAVARDARDVAEPTTVAASA